MKVSIITPSYNGSQFIETTIMSVLNQSYENWELIIIDDNSTDNSVEIIQKFLQQDHRIILIQNDTNLGAAKSRNLGISRSKGRFIAFLDGDDYWYPNKLSVQIEFMIENSIEFSYCKYDFINEEGSYLDKPASSLSKKSLSYHKVLKNFEIGCLTVVYDTNIIGKPLMPEIKKRQDYAYWLKILKKGYYAHPIHETLASYRIRKKSISSNKFKLIKYNWLVFYKLEDLGLIKSAFYFLNWVIKGILKYFSLKFFNQISDSTIDNTTLVKIEESSPNKLDLDEQVSRPNELGM